MLKMIAIGMLGAMASVGGVWLNQYVAHQGTESTDTDSIENKLLQVKTEMTGIPIISNGDVIGYVIFQISSTIDVSKLPEPEFNVSPYILDAAILASFESTENGELKFNPAFLRKLGMLIQETANRKLNSPVLTAVNLTQFNYVPKADIRGNVMFSGKSDVKN
jgi:hypothetical protein